MKAPSRATLSPKGERGSVNGQVGQDRSEGGHLAAEPRFKIPDSRWKNSVVPRKFDQFAGGADIATKSVAT
jgi:hypothetical protein